MPPTNSNFTSPSGDVNSTLSNITMGVLSDLMASTTTIDPSQFIQETNFCEGLNVSCACHTEYSSYEPLERIILGLVAVPVIMFGILANVTSMRIFTHRIMSSSSINWYLAVLSASDTLILVSAFFVLSLPRFGEYLTWWRANYISYSVTPYMYGLMMTAQTCSVFMTVGVSVHRYIGVCHPYKSVEWLPKKRVTTFIIGLLTFSVIFNTTRFFEVHISNVCYRANIDYYMPSLQPTALRNSHLYKQLFFGWVYTVVMYVVPFTLLIALNSMVLSAVRRSRRMHMVSQCGAESEEFSKKAERKERQTSIMLVAIVLLFISCNTLAFVCNVVENMELYGQLYETLVTLNNLLVIINASCNICVYMLFSDKYRMLLRYYLFCDWSRQGELLVSSVLN
ncbi:hypothetical protein GCK72_016164 [Caenorhabditis remanei]|uniref:G-protein coupled receptors family 1 profile domain-containing protein n=1 Tax=Caenorhabditis remanei TaxID=31234 RepID=A0A6A5GWZ1_CAERE|nr:hypothetical protein GCK72_016164 [Caenorhabditis remanei]KAF1759697.1 hypothetical protein GCK72_016164 [Caenorhabditis remanei]